MKRYVVISAYGHPGNDGNLFEAAPGIAIEVEADYPVEAAAKAGAISTENLAFVDTLLPGRVWVVTGDDNSTGKRLECFIIQTGDNP